MCTSSVSNVIYHKFSHGAAFYTLNGKNVNVMLECMLIMLSSGDYVAVSLGGSGLLEPDPVFGTSNERCGTIPPDNAFKLS